MTHRINVLKPFMFSYPPQHGQKLTTEKQFSVGEHEVDEVVANHPWILSGADGRVETPAQAMSRAEKEKKKAEAAQVDADIANAAAEAAVNRLKAAEPRLTASKEEIEAELNTPVNVLKAKREQGGQQDNATPQGLATLSEAIKEGGKTDQEVDTQIEDEKKAAAAAAAKTAAVRLKGK